MALTENFTDGVIVFLTAILTFYAAVPIIKEYEKEGKCRQGFFIIIVGIIAALFVAIVFVNYLN
jgi:predicted PurR-regulated permease PerM